MGAFADFAQEFYDLGLQPVPIEPETKACMIHKSNEHFFYEKLTQEQLDKWIESHGHWEIGIACGAVSGVIGIDFDFQGQDWEKYERLLIGDLEPTPIIKKGNKGWTRFYKYSNKIATKHIKKDGVAFVDVLSDGAVTVMPPTPAKNGNIYRYITPDTFQDVLPHELPDFTAENLNFIHSLADSSVFEQMPFEQANKSAARHDTIFRRILKISNKLPTIEAIANDVIAFDFAVHKTHPKGFYFEDPKYLKGKSAFDVAMVFTKKAVEWKRGKLAAEGREWSLGEKDLNFWICTSEEKQTYKASRRHDDFCTFFDAYLHDARKEYLSGIMMQKKNGTWKPVENYFPSLETQARQCGLSPTLVQKDFYLWAERKPREFTFDIPLWDKKDHISKLFSYISVDNVSQEIMAELMKEWLANIWRRIYNSEIQNHFVIFQGAQGIGKDWFINFMLKGFGDYYSEIMLDRSKVENYKSVETLFACYVPEFDETAKIPLSVLKSFVTASKATYRASYARQAELVNFHHSCISSVNFSDMLRDSSGNRRFMLFELSGIDFAYRKNVDPNQILAQSYALFKAEFKASKEARKAMDIHVSEQTPEDSRELLALQLKAVIERKERELSEARDRFYSDGNSLFVDKEIVEDDFKIRWPMIADEVSRHARLYGISLKNAQMLLKRVCTVKRDKNGMIYAAVQQGSTPFTKGTT